MLDADTDIGFFLTVFIITGVCGTPFNVIVALVAPEGASIFTPPIPFPVEGNLNS